MKVDFVGWRGMVGSALMQHTKEENDFVHIPEAFFLTTSSVGGTAPDFGQAAKTLLGANDVAGLMEMGIIVTCQGGDYAKSVFQPLRGSGWNGYWIDAASLLCMKDDMITVPDLVSHNVIDDGLKNGVENYIDDNCTVSLVLMTPGGLLQDGLIEWTISVIYRTASGADTKNIRELISDMDAIHVQVVDELADPFSAVLGTDRKVSDLLRSGDHPKANSDVPPAGSLTPWIDVDLGNDQSKEEWKGGVETNKILGRSDNPTVIDGLCIRISSMRCHSQAVTLKLKKGLPVSEIKAILTSANDWVEVIPNEKKASIHELTPAKVTGMLSIPVGRIRKLGMGDGYTSALTVSDQLLWGTIEPLRRMLRIVLDSLQFRFKEQKS